MKILIERPPNYDAVARRFSISGKPVIFAWGEVIYNPSNITIPEHLLHHEAMHCVRQKGRVEAWWERYLTDNDFLISEEVMAHAAEYQYLIGHNDNRHARRGYLKQTAKRLAGPLYGNLLTVNKALALLKAKV